MCCGISPMRPARSPAVSSRALSVAMRVRLLLGVQGHLRGLVGVDLSRRRWGDGWYRRARWARRHRFILGRRLLQFESALVDQFPQFVVRELGHVLRVL